MRPEMLPTTRRNLRALCALLIAATTAPSLDAQVRRNTRRVSRASARERQLEEALRVQTARVTTAYCEDFESLVVLALRKGLKERAEQVIDRVASLDPEYEDLERMRAALGRVEQAEGEGLEKLREDFDERLERVDERHAKRLFSFAERCFELGLFSRSYDLLLQVLELAPDPRSRYQRTARSILGYVWDREEKRWITEWEARRKRTHVLTDEGWVPKRDMRKWQEGLRPYKGKWVSAERERQIRERNEFNPYWVESEHFIVRTNLGRKQAWQFARRLEDFYRIFYRFFVGYYDQVASASVLFRRAEVEKKHEVYLFPSRTDYLIHVKGEQGNDKLLRESAGFYSPADRMSRFYWTEDDLESTLATFYHETAHQLFAETKETNRSGSRGNNWVVEGIATYIETWEEAEGKWYPGRNTERPDIQLAKSYLASNDSWRLSEFVTIDNHEFHEQDRELNYALGGALCHFFCHYDNEVYKEDFIRFLSDYYAGKVKKYSLVDYIDVPDVETPSGEFGALEKQFREYMAGL